MNFLVSQDKKSYNYKKNMSLFTLYFIIIKSLPTELVQNFQETLKIVKKLYLAIA